MSQHHPFRVSRPFLVLIAATVALPIGGSAQQLDTIPGLNRLRQQLGAAINSTICLALANDPTVNRDDGSPAGELFGRCNDLIATATEINSGTPGGNSLGLTAGELNAALDSLAHTQVPAIGRGASEITLVHAGVIADRLYALRQGEEGVQIAGYAYDEEGRRVDFDDLLSTSGAAGDDDLAGSGVGGFLNLKGGFGKRDNSANGEERGFDYYNTGATLGIDARIDERIIAGIAGGYTHGERDFNRSGGDIESETASGFVFGGFEEQGFYVDGLYGFSYHWIDTGRRIIIPIGPAPSGSAMPVIRTARGDTEAIEHQVSGNAGYLFERDGLGVGPTVGIEYIRLDIDDFDESAGGLALSYDDDDIDSLILNVGGEVSYDISTGFGIITPQVRAEWAHQFEDDSRTITANFLFDPTNSKFFVRTSDPDRDYVDLSASIAATLSGGVSAFVAYDTILGHSDLTAHMFTLGGRIEF